MTDGNEAVYPNVSGDRRKVGDAEIETMRSSGGLTKREYFATMAMQGFVSGIDFDDPATQKSPDLVIGAMAIFAVRSADALIAALNKEEKL